MPLKSWMDIYVLLGHHRYRLERSAPGDQELPTVTYSVIEINQLLRIKKKTILKDDLSDNMHCLSYSINCIFTYNMHSHIVLVTKYIAEHNSF